MAAAALQQRVAAPLPTPLTAFVPVMRGLSPRSFSNNTFTSGSQGPDCGNFDGFNTCSSTGNYGRCLATASASICGCSEGLEYLDCVSAAIATSSCWGAVGIADWDSYERSWIQGLCPTPASTVMAQLPQPSSVQVELAPVNIVTPPATALPPTTNRASVAQPTSTFDGEGSLLAQSTCKSASYTLVEAGDVVYYAAVIGCMGDRPECCPWSVSVEGSGGPTTASFEGNRVAGGAGRFPVPASGLHAVLARCPDDYYSVSGQCCPHGYFKFTTLIAFQTPCFSFLSSLITPPVLTAGLAANPTDTRLPTSAILNVALAMSYNVTSDAPGLSKPAAIGIGVGVGVSALALAAITAWVCIRARKKKREAQAPTQTHVTGQVETRYQDHDPGVVYQRGYNAPPGSPPMSSGSLPTPSPPPVWTPSSYAPVAGHSRNWSDASDGGWSGGTQYQGHQQGGGYDGYQAPYQGQQEYQQEYHGQQPWQHDERFGGYQRG
ncbi:hypothetical protein OQA88_729 [Cercophora sp. LCS_1]